MTTSTSELVQQAKNGDQDAIGALYEQSYSEVYRKVKAYIKDEDTVLDIVQDSFVKGFENLDKLSDPEKFTPWLKMIAYHKAMDYLRGKHPTLFTDLENEDGEMMEFSDDNIAHLPDEMLDRKETIRLVREIVDDLPEEQRAVIMMRFYDGMSVKEVAQALGCPENTVKSRSKYGLEKVEGRIRNLAAKGTKLYSLAPLPYFIWLLRMAKAQEIPAAALSATTEAAVGAAATQAAADAAAKATGSAAKGTAKGAAKGAAKAGAKSLSRKIVAGTLAVTVAGGAGVVAVNHLRNPQQENEAAHVVYEEFLDRYKTALEADYEIAMADYNQFWEEVSEDIWEQNPDADRDVYTEWSLDYTPGEDFREGIPVPDTLYEPNMNGSWLQTYYRLEDQEIRYAYFDANGDGIDELFLAQFYRDEIQLVQIDGYTVIDGKLIRGNVDWEYDGSKVTWKLEPGVETGRVGDHGTAYIHMGTDAFSSFPVINMPDCDWKVFCNYFWENS